MNPKKALIVVDYQNGFIPEAASGVNELPVEGGELLAPVINNLMRETKTAGELIVATRDWHPAGHMSFAANYNNRELFREIGENDVNLGNLQRARLNERAAFQLTDLKNEFKGGNTQILWPDHCIAGTPGAEYFSELDQALIDRHIIKGYEPRIEMYSGFDGKEQREDKKEVKLADILREAGVELVKIVGLATDFCVNATALGALKNGFNVQVITKAIAGVNPDESIKRLEELREKGAEIIE